MFLALAIALASVNGPAPKVLTLPVTVIVSDAPHVWTCGRPRESLAGGTVKECK